MTDHATEDGNVVISESTIPTYLRSKGVVDDGLSLTIESLGGGVSNRVYRVDWEGDAIVLKQPLGNLAVDEDWPASVERVHNEAAAARVYDAVIEHGTAKDIRVPSVRFEDDDAHVIAIDAAPRSASTWKRHLLNGKVDATIARRLGRFLGESHAHTVDTSSIRDRFDSYRPFVQLRLEPYHETVATRHPDVAAEIRAEIDRLRSERSALVHGDFSPKNVLVESTDPEPVLWLLDFEVAHWGDPIFDVAFMMNHLAIKSVHRSVDHRAYLSALESFWDGYRRVDDPITAAHESDVIVELGVLMLARIDGKSPVEYLESAESAERLRSIAKACIRGEVGTMRGLKERLTPQP